MKMRFLGKTGIKVSEICFGTMTFGGRGMWTSIGELDQKQADELVNICLDSGVNFFDTADVYSEGLAEEILGKALGNSRKNIILATKVRGSMGPGPNDVGLSRYHIIEGCNASLRRLNTDFIDLYQVHSYDPATPLEETLSALNDLVHQGKIRYFGCSNFCGWQLMKALAISEKNHWEKFVTLQALYSLMARDLELELVPLAQDQGLGILPWSPLYGGFLTGKFRKDKPKPQGTRRSGEQQFLKIHDEAVAQTVIDTLDKIAVKHNASIAQAALNYLLRKPGVSSVIIGARTPEQLRDNLKASDWELTADEIVTLDSLTEPPRIYPYWFLGGARHNR